MESWILRYKMPAVQTAPLLPSCFSAMERGTLAAARVREMQGFQRNHLPRIRCGRGLQRGRANWICLAQERCNLLGIRLPFSIDLLDLVLLVTALAALTRSAEIRIWSFKRLVSLSPALLP
jgi:hypothetical protein